MRPTQTGSHRQHRSDSASAVAAPTRVKREYHSTLRLWREVLTQEGDLARTGYPFLRFGDYLGFDSPVSIPDALWKTTSDIQPEDDLDQKLLEFDK